MVELLRGIYMKNKKQIVKVNPFISFLGSNSGGMAIGTSFTLIALMLITYLTQPISAGSYLIAWFVFSVGVLGIEYGKYKGWI